MQRGVEVQGQARVAGQLGGGAADACRRAAPRRTPRAAAPARPAAGRRTPPRRAARAGTRSAPRPATSRFISTAWRSPSSRALGSSPDAAASSSWATRRPATLAARTTWRAASSTRSRRTSSTSARSSGTQRPGRGRRADQLLDEERVALRAVDDVAPPRRLARAPPGPPPSSATSVRTSPGDSGVRWIRSTPRSRDHSATWARRGGAGAGRRSGTTRRRRPGRPKRPGEQEAEQVPGRLVGPVQVLDDQQQRGVRGRRLEQRVHGLEQRGPVECATARRPRSAPIIRRPGCSRPGRGARSRPRRRRPAGRPAIRPRTSENGR